MKIYTFREFEEIFTELIHRDGAEGLLNWLRVSDFREAPASTKFHGNYPGGLCNHSVNVYYELQRLLAAYPEIYCSDETAAIIALLHDVCKVNFYSREMRNKKIDGVWQEVPSYTIEEKFCFAGYHGPKSVWLIERYMKLTPEEAVAIAGHMGNEDGKFGPYLAYERMPLAWLLHVADESATVLIEPNDEKEKENKI